jgi:hypothetical protein
MSDISLMNCPICAEPLYEMHPCYAFRDVKPAYFCNKCGKYFYEKEGKFKKNDAR